MDMGVFRGLMLLVMMGAFITIVAWAWSRRQRESFSEASQLPLADDERPAPPPRTHVRAATEGRTDGDDR